MIMKDKQRGVLAWFKLLIMQNLSMEIERIL